MQSEKYLNHVRSYPCIACLALGRRNYNTFAHHEDLTNKYRYNKRASDFVAVPLCITHHYERHRLGREKFWQKYLSDYRGIYTFVIILLKSFFGEENFENIDDDYFLSIEGEFTIRNKFDELLDYVEKLYEQSLPEKSTELAVLKTTETEENNHE